MKKVETRQTRQKYTDLEVPPDPSRSAILAGTILQPSVPDAYDFQSTTPTAASQPSTNEQFNIDYTNE